MIMSIAMKRKKKKKGMVASLYRNWVLISAIFACLLLLILFALLSLLALSPLPQDVNGGINIHHQGKFRSNLVFHVPASEGSEHDLWSSKHSELFSGCSKASFSFPKASIKTHPDRYLLIATSGGLNQQRIGITDAVVVAYLLNATLVVPELDHESFWRDTSNFSEIFDVEWFISYLQNDVRVIKQVPNTGGNFVAPYSMCVPRKSTPKFYEDQVLPVLIKKRNWNQFYSPKLILVNMLDEDLEKLLQVVLLTKFDYRVSNMLDEDLQKLRCRVNFHALKFTASIQIMGEMLVERMRMKSKHFIALHLRFEPDMLAFSGCYYGGGDKERIELGEIRKLWKNLHAKNPEKVRRHGRCPLTPEEVGMMLRALGYGSDVKLYVASGEIYGGEETLAPLKALFPNLHSKETIATKEELAPFASFSSRMAALDFLVCDNSDVFVTNNNGNMAKILAGRRRYFGHKLTIRPNAKKLNRLFMNRDNITWEEFASGVRKSQLGFMGEPNELRPGSGDFYQNPSSCICEHSQSKTEGFSDPQNQSGDNLEDYENMFAMTEHKFTEEEMEWPDADYLDSGNQIQLNGTSKLLMGKDQTELQEFFAD